MLVWFEEFISAITRDGLVLCDSCDDVNPVRYYSCIKPGWYMSVRDVGKFIAYCTVCKVGKDGS